MPCLLNLSKELLVRVLDFSSDTSVLELAAASCAVKTEVEECRPLGSEGSWRHPAGAWNSSGLWRFLALGDLKKIPSVSLCCEVEFQNVTETLAFLKAAKNLAADTSDDHVSFNQFVFLAADVNELFCDDGDGPLWCEADHKAAIEVKGGRIQCSLVATRTSAIQDAPRTLFLDVDRTRRRNPRVICNSLLARDLRLQSRHGNIEFYGDLTNELAAGLKVSIFWDGQKVGIELLGGAMLGPSEICNMRYLKK